jgi:hypothetical protein
MSILPNDDQIGQINIPNIEIQEITLINSTPVNESSPLVAFTVYPRNANEPMIFDSLILDEDMFSESVSGTLYFFDPAFIVEQLNFTSYDIVKIKYTAQESTKTATFRIVEIATEANTVSKQILGPFGNTIPVAIKFASDQLVYKNFDTMLLKSFIGRISSGSPTSSNGYTNNVPNLEKCGKISGPGFVQYVFQEFGFGANQGEDAPKQLEADPTYNDVWFKINPAHYPWSKIGVPAKIGQMMNYICEYACYEKNPNAVNFFFWEDLDKFNFKCVESLLEKPIKATYTPSLNENDLNAIVDLQIIAETPVSKLVNNGAFSGEYVRVIPSWANPYNFISDTAESLNRYQVVYDYYGSFNAFKKISTHPPVDQKDVSLIYSPNRINDSNYGYYQDAYGQGNRPWWNYWDSSYKHYQGELIGGITGEVERIEGNYWQAQFDMCELPASCLKKIYEKIKWPLSQKRSDYVYLKRQDTKWKFYRNTILGERNQPTSFYAILLDAVKIYDNGAGGIYQYKFEEIEFWFKRDQGKGFRNQYSVQKVVADKNYPFSIVTVPWGIKGNAYNLNEFLNTTLPKDKEESSDEGFQTALISPGASSQVLKGDNSINGVVMQPVGRFRSQSSADNETIINHYVGRIVKIDVISSKMVDLLIPATSFPCGFPPKQELGPMFIFDVENSGYCITKPQQ